MASCLYECLCEAELEKYYPHFAALGFQRIDELARVSMKDYAKLGVHNMKDRKRLFQLIRIIKVLQAEDEAAGKKWQPFQLGALHLRPQVTRYGPRRQLHFDSLSEESDGRKAPGSDLSMLSSCSADKDKEDLASLLSHNSELKGSVKSSLNAAAERWTEQKLCVPAVGSSNDLAPLLGDIGAPIVQRVAHTSGYNYGVPHSSIRANSSEKETPWTETDKIRVCVRKRPLGLREERRGEVNIITVEDKETLLLHEKKEAVDLTQYILQHVFYFDEVFGEACSNRDVYMKTAYPLIQHIFSGGNATCFAYGQTGAGKTYTMIGTQQNPGLYALAAQDIFRHLETSQARKDLHVCISFYEIYCGQLYDLLNGRKRLFAREDGKHIVQIVGLREVQVKTVSLLLEVILKGGKERSTGATGVNSDSSRSHAIIQIQIKDTANRASGRISFIDLAGSERAADARDADRQTKMEGAEINQSLLALKECIRALDQEHAHTPFRQSKLTQVLKDSFIGNSKTCMIANVSPSHVATEHTLNTLRYADRVKELKKGIRCCTPIATRRPPPAGASPKRIQSSPYLQAGDKSSPKKVKLGPQHLQASSASRAKGSHLLFHPLCPTYFSTPKGQAHKSPLDGPWFGHQSPVKGVFRTGPLARKATEEPAGHSPQTYAGKNFGAQRSRSQGEQQRGKIPRVSAVQKELISRADLSLANPGPPSVHPEKGGRAFVEQRAAAWTSVPHQQKDREHHLRLFHQQFQQPPILQQKLNYQPLEKFLAQYKSLEFQVKAEPPGQPPASPWSCDETMQLEDLEDSDFSEDSFSAEPSWKKPEVKVERDCGPRSFFLHQGEGGTEAHLAQRRQECELGKEGKALLRPEKVTSSEEGRDSRSEWSTEESSSPDSFPKMEMPEKPYCSQENTARSKEHPRGTDLPPSCPVKRVSALRKASANPPPLCPLGSLSCAAGSQMEDAGRGTHLPHSGTGGEKGLRSGAELGGLLDFSVDLARAESPSMGTLLDSGTPEALRAVKEVMEKNPISSQEPLGEDSRQCLGGKGSPAFSLYEVAPWEREAFQELSPQVQIQWLSEFPNAPTLKEVHSLACGYSARETGAVSFLSSHAEIGDTLLPSQLQGSGSVPGAQGEGDSKPMAPQSCLEQSQLGEGEDSKAVARFAGTGSMGKTFGSGVLPGSDATIREDCGQSSSFALGTQLDCWHSEETLKRTFSSEDVGLLRDRLTQNMFAHAVVSKAMSPPSPTNSPDLCKGSPQRNAALGRDFVLQIHREQLDEMAALCSQEESLICQMAGLDFEDFVIKLDEILMLKAKCIQRVQTQLKSFLAPSRATEPQRTSS